MEAKLIIDESKMRVLRGPAWTRTERMRIENGRRERLWTADGGLEAWDPEPQQETTDG